MLVLKNTRRRHFILSAFGDMASDSERKLQSQLGHFTPGTAHGLHTLYSMNIIDINRVK
jgi:hypothetical protein